MSSSAIQDALTLPEIGVAYDIPLPEIGVAYDIPLPEIGVAYDWSIYTNT